jgi:hypothetical protein
MPTLNEWETVKQQCSAFNEMGYFVKCDIQSMKKDAAPAIRIAKGMKTWQFSDPDWQVVIRQLAHLWKMLLKEPARPR